MSDIQALEEMQYSESAKHDRFDGYDRGDTGRSDDESGSLVIGRMTKNNHQVIVTHLWSLGSDDYSIEVDGRCLWVTSDREEAFNAARYWYDLIVERTK